MSTEALQGAVHTPLPHDSAAKHVTGAAEYTDDIPMPAGTLHACLGLAEIACGTLNSLDLDAVRGAPGVIGVLTADDVPGVDDISPTGIGDETVFGGPEIRFHGQPIFAVVAETRTLARAAARLARATYSHTTPLLDAIDSHEEDGGYVTEPLTLARGDAAAELEKSANRISGRIRVGGQEHMYLEGHISAAIPGEDEDVTIWASTQHPSEVQQIAAKVLGIASHAVTVKVRRMGGGFGGKETQMNLYAVVAAMAAKRWGKPVKLRPDRDDDIVTSGKRHDIAGDYELGFDDDGRIQAVRADVIARCGISADLSGPVTDRALFHADNAYFYPHVHLQSHPMMTNTVSNTAFRGFGGPQGMMVAERMIEEIAYALGEDPLEIRKRNLYGPERDVTPYHQRVEDNILPRLISELESTSDYAARRRSVLERNKAGGVLRHGIALVPVKFGISFTATWMNQAGALVHVYKDGSIYLNHGGTEMGQGLNTKVAQVAADAFQVDVSRVKISATATDKVPNTSPTAASAGTDLNAMAALDACNQIKARLVEFAAEHWQAPEDAVRFVPGGVQIRDELVAFNDVVNAAYFARVHLSAAGYYRTPKVHWDRATGRGRPFYYYANGASVAEVTLDTLTGEHRVDRVDILHDVGRSLNPAIDLGQIEGGFIQGMGWLTSEELWWDAEGRLRTHAPSTYKIPLASDAPREFNVRLADWSENAERTIKRSKAVGEPPLMLAMSAFEALSMAVASVANYQVCPRLDAPATPERLLMAVERLRQQTAPA
ncbi:MAG: xanthine dehydrogenase molybdopterin binding subunit [Pseudomonadota bacterium]